MKKNGVYILAGGFATLALSGYIFRKQIKTKIKSFTNLQHLETLNPGYKKNFVDFYNAVIQKGYTPQINSSYRSFEQQAQEKKADKRNGSPGFSPHNYGIALDMQVSKNGQTWGKSTPINKWMQTGIPQLANKFGLAWGGNLKGYSDSVHFYVPLDTSRLYTMALAQFKTKNPRNIKGNQLKIV